MINQVADKNLKLIFKDGNKDGKLEVVVIRSDEFEGHQYVMSFKQKNGNTSLDHFTPIGEVSTDDPGRIPPRFFNPAIKQARAIFSDYRRRNKDKALSAQARMIA